MKLSRLLSWLAPIVLAAANVTCGGPSEPHSDATEMRAFAGDAQTAPVGTTLPLALVILVTDVDGKRHVHGGEDHGVVQRDENQRGHLKLHFL